MVALPACNGSAFYAPPPPAPEAIAVRVLGEPDEPVAEAEVAAGERLLGRTDASGLAQFDLTGTDGTKFDLVVRCPASHGGASRPLTVVLRRGSRAPEYATSCKRTVSTAIVLVRAQGGIGLPVMYLGREVARIDDSGVALVHLEVGVADTFTLTLDTKDPRYRTLRPQNPEMTFAGAAVDELYLFDTKLHEERLVVRRAPRPPVHVPQRLLPD